MESSEPVKSLLSAIPLASSHSPPPLALTPTIHHTMTNYHDTTLSAFSLWPDALATGEETAAWTQPVVYAGPSEVDGEGIPLDILDLVLAGGQSGRSRMEAPTSETDFVSIQYSPSGWERTHVCHSPPAGCLEAR